MKVAPYKYIISQDIKNSGRIILESSKIYEFESILDSIFYEVNLAFKKDTGVNLDNFEIELIDSDLPYASIQNCLDEYTIHFSSGMKNLLYGFSFLCVIGYQYTSVLSHDYGNAKAWATYRKVFKYIDLLLNTFFVDKTYDFDLIECLKDLNICCNDDLQQWSFQAHEIFEGAIRFIIAHEVSHVYSEKKLSKVNQEESADEMAFRILLAVSDFRIKKKISKKYLKKLFDSDFYCTYKAAIFCLFLFMLIDMKQDKMNVYKPCCGFNSNEHPSAEHRCNRILLNNLYDNIPTARIFLKWRSSLIHVISFLDGKLDIENFDSFKESFLKY